MSKLTAEERVDKGIKWLDNDPKGVVPPYWRFKVNPDKMMFANISQSPLAQIFGSHTEGRKKLNLVFDDSLGFRAAPKKHGDPAALKKAWQGALNTEQNWKKVHSFVVGEILQRQIKGLTFEIYHSRSSNMVRWSVRLGNGRVWGSTNTYKDFESAKRAVRRFIADSAGKVV